MIMLAQAHKQTLLLFKGHPATGKSLLANALAHYLAWPLIDKDDIKDHTYALHNGGHLSYEIMWQIVRHQLQIGLSVLVDSPLSYETSYITGQELAAMHNSRLLVVETHLDEGTWKDRLERRLDEQQTHRTSGWAGIQKLLANYNNSWRYSIAPEHHLIVDTSQPIDLLVQTVVDFIEQPSKFIP